MLRKPAPVGARPVCYGSSHGFIQSTCAVCPFDRMCRSATMVWQGTLSVSFQLYQAERSLVNASVEHAATAVLLSSLHQQFFGVEIPRHERVSSKMAMVVARIESRCRTSGIAREMYINAHLHWYMKMFDKVYSKRAGYIPARCFATKTWEKIVANYVKLGKRRFNMPSADVDRDERAVDRQLRDAVIAWYDVFALYMVEPGEQRFEDFIAAFDLPTFQNETMQRIVTLRVAVRCLADVHKDLPDRTCMSSWDWTAFAAFLRSMSANRGVPPRNPTHAGGQIDPRFNARLYRPFQ